MRLRHDEVAALIPHAGSMVLLDDVVEWDEARIVCHSTMHRDRANPLYVAGRLSSVCGIEFAAQAMAVHGALLMRRDHAISGDGNENDSDGGPAKPRAGFLASVRSVDLHVARLDDVRSVLTIEAAREAGDGHHVLYRFGRPRGRRVAGVGSRSRGPRVLRRMTDIKPKRALVTGGSGDIGAAICRRLADEYDVVVHANTRLDRAQVVVDAIVDAGGTAHAVRFDVRDANATAAAIEAMLNDGPIQVLVNNAGIHDDAVFPGMRAEQWSSVIDVSLNGFFHVTQPLTMPMIRTRWGRIVNISSLAAVAGNRGQVNYAAAKAALHGATRSLAIELASRGITVNAVAPGIIAGAMSEGSFDAKAIETMVPMKRAGTPDEVADLVAFLASDRASYITGQIISINGGIAA